MKKKHSFFYLIFLSLLFILGLGITECILRFIGYQPAQDPPVILENIKPSSCIKADSTIGYSLKPGTYQYNYKNGYSFTATHNQKGWRITSRNSNIDTTRASIHFYGGSVFYGFGLQDSSVFAYQLAQQLPNVRIRNYGIYGHGMVTPYMLIKRQTKQDRKPDIAIVSYASYNLPRNVYSRLERKTLRINNTLRQKDLYYRCARLNKDQNDLRFPLKRIDYTPLPLIEKSALMNHAEKTYTAYEHQSYHPKLVDSLLIEKYVNFCRANNIKLIFAFITKNEYTQKVLNRLQNKNVLCADIYVDYDKNKYNLLPHDNHPNAKTHKLYSERLLKYLQEHELLDG